MLGEGTSDNQDSYVDLLSNLNIGVPGLDKTNSASNTDSQSQFEFDPKNQTLNNFKTPFFGGGKEVYVEGMDKSTK